MTILWKKIMFIRYMLRICVVLHISSSFHKCADCALVITPQDVVAVSGEVVTLNCSSGCGNIAWITKDPETFIYANNITAPSVLTYITVDDRDDGSCNLNIAATAAAAKRYFCKELNSEAEAGAELVVIEKNAECTRVNKAGSHIVKCSVVSAGKWAPTVICEELNDDGTLNGLQGTQPNNTDNNVVTNYWTFISKKDDSCNMISCSIAFQPTGIPKTWIDPDCPPCDFRDNELPLRKRVLNSNENRFWTLANRCFPTEFRNLQRGFDNASVILSKFSCSISVIALFVTIFIYVCTWKKQFGSTHSFLLPMLCITLSIAYIIFVAGILDSKGDCKAAVIWLHYFLLVASFIMLADGVDLLLYLITKERKRFEIAILLAAGFVLPVFILPLGFTKVEGIDRGLVCWLSVDYSFIRSFFGLVLLVFMVDIGVLVVVQFMVYRKKYIHRKNEIKIREIRSALWNMSVTCPLLSLGSLFCVLYSSYGTVIFMHLFAVVNLLQGVLIFFFHGIFNNKIVNAKLKCGSLVSKDTDATKDPTDSTRTSVKGPDTSGV